MKRMSGYQIWLRRIHNYHNSLSHRRKVRMKCNINEIRRMRRESDERRPS